MRAFAFVGVVVGLTLSAAAHAQPVPSLAPSFTLDGAEPSPCFEFACFSHSAFDGNTLVAVGAVLPNVYVWVRDSAGAWSQQAVLTRPDPNAPPSDQEFGSLLAIDGNDVVVSGGAIGGAARLSA